MLDLLPHFARIWIDEREKTDEIGRAIIENLNKAQASQSGGDLNATHLDRCYEALSVAYDPMYGGFGQEPKFPTPMPSPFCFAIITGQEMRKPWKWSPIRSGKFD